MLYNMAEELRKLASVLEQSAQSIDASCLGLRSVVFRTNTAWQDPRADGIAVRLTAAMEEVSAALGSLYPEAMAFIHKQLDWFYVDKWD